MASYDKQKLLALMEKRRVAHLSLIDLSARHQETRRERSAILDRIRTDSGNYRLPSGYLDRLLNLPTNEALSLSSDDVQTYVDGPGEAARRYKTGVAFSAYRRYIQARDTMARLDTQLQRARENWEQFEIVPRLIDAVRGWGFTDPELEM